MPRTPTLLALSSAAILLASVAASPSVALAQASPTRSNGMTCAELSAFKMPETLRIKGELVIGGTFQPPDQKEPITDLPSFCRVSIVVAPRIHIELWLPTRTWNNRFQAVGNGGFAGSISWFALGAALRDGYATASTDTGHTSAPPPEARGATVPPGDGSWGMAADGTLQWGLIEDFASRALFEMTIKSKATIQAFYGRPPRYSYWTGCSTGGRQGLMQVQRSPDAYDGVLAGAPAINWDRFIPGSLWPQVVMKEEVGRPLDACKLELAASAAVTACDDLDGVKDGLIRDPRQCRFDPKALQCSADAKPGCACLTDAEARAIRRIWDGAHTTAGERLWFGPEPGAPLSAIAGPEAFLIADWHLRWVRQDPNADWRALNRAGYEKSFADVRLLFHDVIGTDDPDLSRFRVMGGKLIMWHGWTDELIPPRGTVDYYERVAARMGGLEEVQRFARLFMAPGVNHCTTGAGPNVFGQASVRFPPPPPARDARHDIVLALVRWVESGVAPDRIIATKYFSDDRSRGIARQRPICMYPQVAVYNGSGSFDNAGSFACRSPADGSAGP